MECADGVDPSTHPEPGHKRRRRDKQLHAPVEAVACSGQAAQLRNGCAVKMEVCRWALWEAG